MSRTTLQIPLDSLLRDQAEEMALASGFSSIQEVVRVFLKKLATQRISVGFYENEVKLSPIAEKRYSLMVRDAQRGENIVKADSYSELLSLLD